MPFGFRFINGLGLFTIGFHSISFQLSFCDSFCNLFSFGFRFISGSICCVVVPVFCKFCFFFFHLVCYKLIIFNGYKVTEMEAVLQQHDTSMPGRHTLEALAEKFR